MERSKLDTLGTKKRREALRKMSTAELLQVADSSGARARRQFVDILRFLARGRDHLKLTKG